MAEPFSIITAAAGLIDLCWRFGCYLQNVQARAAKIDHEIERLLHDIEALRAVNETVQASYQALPSCLDSEVQRSEHVDRLWRNVSSNLESCRLVVEELEALVTSIVGREPPKDEHKILRKLDGFKKQLRKQSREGDFDRLRRRLSTYHRTIQLMLDLIIWLAHCFADYSQG